MDEKAAYELTIAEKLEQLTVPDKVDAIWARIEAMLDIDMPTDDGPGEPPADPPSGGLWNIKSLAFIFIAALIAIIFLTNKKPGIKTNENNIPHDSATIIDQPNNTNNKPPPADIIQPLQRTAPDTSASIHPSVPLPVNMDSLLFKGGDNPPAVRTDSVMNNVPDIPAALPPTDTTKKKSRGVKGITDDDYRIVPHKDSVP